MKFRAFAKVNGSYIYEEGSDFLKYFYIWDVAYLKKNKPEYFNSLTFYSTYQNEQYRSELVPVIKGSKKLFYRYKDAGGYVNNENGDNETISHHLAILALSGLKKLNFVINNQKLIFNVKRIKHDCEQIKFENGNIYIPDIIVEFTEGDPLYYEWGGKVALEIMVNHSCTPKKIHDFERHNLPIIEIKLTDKMRFEKYYKEPSSENANEYLLFLREKFSSLIYGKILSNPMQTDIARKSILFLERKNNEILKRLSLVQIENEKIDGDNYNLKKHIEVIEKELDMAKGRLKEFNKSTVFAKIVRSIFYTPSV